METCNATTVTTGTRLMPVAMKETVVIVSLVCAS
jgi:hypothetical protein